MGGKKLTARSIKRKSGPTHPGSRRAAQLARVSHREFKLQKQRAARSKGTSAKVNRLLTIVLLLPPELPCLDSPAALHAFLQDSYLSRHSAELSSLESSRRAGRPPAKREVELKEQYEKEKREYEAGIEVPDLCSETNVRLLRDWEGEAGFVPMIRFVRVSGTYPDQWTVVQEGKHKELALERAREAMGQAESMPVDALESAEDEAAASKAEASRDESMSFRRADSFANMDGPSA